MAFSIKQSPAAGAMLINDLIDEAARSAGYTTRQIDQVIQLYGRPAIDAALGADAAKLDDFYNKLETFRAAVSATAVKPTPG